MKSILFITLLIYLTLAAPPPRKNAQRRPQPQKKPYTPVYQNINNNNVTLLHYENYNDGLGPYQFSFQSSDGISREESSQVTKDPKGELEIIVTGSYSFVAPDGVTYTVNYIADENGYRVL